MVSSMLSVKSTGGFGEVIGEATAPGGAGCVRGRLLVAADLKQRRGGCAVARVDCSG